MHGRNQIFSFLLGGFSIFSFYSLDAQFSSELFPETSVRAAVEIPAELRVSDLNGDQIPEIVVANFYGGYISLFLTDTVSENNQFFTERLDIPSSYNAEELEIVDIDGDGLLDIVNSSLNAISIIRNSGQGEKLTLDSFDPYINLPTQGNSYDMDVGDLNNDGKPEIVATATNLDTNYVHIFVNNSSSGSVSVNDFTRLDYQTTDSIHFYNIMLEDINGDFKPEIIFTVDSFTRTGEHSTKVIDSYIRILENHSEVGTIELNSFPKGKKLDVRALKFVFFDIDGNNSKELITASADITLYENTCYSEGSNDYCYSIKSWFNQISILNMIARDVDNDTKTDLVISDFNDGIVLFQNTSSPGLIDFNSFDVEHGIFDKGQAYSLTGPADYFCLADIDGNDENDLIVSGIRLNDSIYIYHNQPLEGKQSEENPTHSSEMSADKIAMYPNPAKNQLYLEHPRFSTIQIYNLQGKLMVNQYSDSKRTRLNTTKLMQGIYLLKIRSGGQTIT